MKHSLLADVLPPWGWLTVSVLCGIGAVLQIAMLVDVCRNP